VLPLSGSQIFLVWFVGGTKHNAAAADSIFVAEEANRVPHRLFLTLFVPHCVQGVISPEQIYYQSWVSILTTTVMQ
jgi:hypothetical protein